MNKIQVMCNTGPIIGLLSIGKLPLLWTLFENVMIPQAVYDEICAESMKHQDEIQTVKEAIRNGNITIYRVNNKEIVDSMYGRLHKGELEVIVGAKERGIKLAVIDDLSARKLADEIMLDTIGIVGLLLAAKRDGIVDEIKPDIDKLRNNGYYISERLYRKVLEKAEEL